MTKESVKRERELIAQLRKAKSLQEVLERAKALKWDISEDKVREYLELITPEEPKEMENRTQKDGLSVEESMPLIDGTMTAEEWIAWMVERNEERKNQQERLKDEEIDRHLIKKEDKFVDLLVEASLCEDQQKKKALFDKAWGIGLQEYSGGGKEENKELQGESGVTEVKEKENKGRDIDPEIKDKLCDLLEAKTESEKEAAWRNLFDGDGWKLSKEDIDFLLDRDEQSPEGDA